MCVSMLTYHWCIKYLRAMLDGHGDDSYQYARQIVSNFSSNVYNQTDLSGLRAHLIEHLKLITAYPHPEAASLQQAIATKSGISPRQVCVTNGSVESIYLIAQLFREKRSGIWIPTFSEYGDACRIHHHRIEAIDEWKDLERFDLVWLCNPNNPTGKVYDKEWLTKQISHYPDVLFVIDQAYEWFTKKPIFSPKEAVAFSNVILLHSMTKRFAIPGLRLGYLTAQDKWIRLLRACRMPWSVNTLAIAAGHYLLENDLKPSALDVYLQEKDRLAESLQAIASLEVLPSDTHFMLVCLRKGKAGDLKDFLANDHGLLIRDASNFEGLDDSYIRIATQTPAENDALVCAIRSSL